MRELTPEYGATVRRMTQFRVKNTSRMTIGQITLAVRDLDNAVKFYGGTVGLRFVSKSENTAFFDCGGVRLALERTSLEAPMNSTVYFRVAEMAPAIAAMRERGIVFEREAHVVAHFPQHDLLMAFFRDIEGNQVGLMCERRREEEPFKP